jgi:hypothetical protein
MKFVLTILTAEVVGFAVKQTADNIVVVLHIHSADRVFVGVGMFFVTGHLGLLSLKVKEVD